MANPQGKPQSSEAVTPAPRSPRSEVALPPGTVLADNFVVENVVGEGGMAVVYTGRQKSLNRRVAIKVLHSRFVRDPEFLERFEAEAGALAALSHPNVVNIIDRGNDGLRYFFVMEYVEGKTLDQMIIENTLEMKDWRAVVAACRDALDYIHRNGVVHRDIKPSNILLGRESAIKIGDFGIAHIVKGESAKKQSGTQAARALGTQNYMAPEQILDPASVDHRADVYSLGVAFYKMLARAMPVGDCQMPSEANHKVPVAVDAVICKAMNEDRNLRHQSVQAFCDELLAALKEQTVSITSVLSYRNSPTPTNSLYTGSDFRTPIPVSKIANKGATPKPVRKMLTPRPLAGKKAAEEKERTARALTPKPAKTTSAPVEKPKKGLIVGVALVAALLAAAIVGVLVKGRTEPPPTAAPGEIVPISEQQDRLRDEIIREKTQQNAPDTAPETTQ